MTRHAVERGGGEGRHPRVVGFGIVGCGGIGRWHAKTIADLPGAGLLGAMDVDSASRDSFAKKFGVHAYASLAELLAVPEVEVISVCTPPLDHATVVTAAAAVGKHVLVEKPLAVDLEEADRAISACARAGVHLGVVHQQRARSASRAVYRLLHSGRLGAPSMAVLVHTWFRPESEDASGSWRADPSAGGGILADQAVHALDLLVWLLGVPRRASGWVGPRPGGGGEHTAAAVLAFDCDLIATLAASLATNAMRDDIALELYGSLGSVRLEIRDYDHAEIAWLDLAPAEGRRARRLARDEVEGIVRDEGGKWRTGPRAWPWRVLGRVAGAERGASPFRSGRGFLRRQIDRVAQRETGELQGHAGVLEAMAAAARGEGEPLVTGAEARTVLAVLDALRRSDQAGGRPVDIDRSACVP